MYLYTVWTPCKVVVGTVFIIKHVNQANVRRNNAEGRYLLPHLQFLKVC